MKIALIGAGLIGLERLEACQKITRETSHKIDVCAVLDPDEKKRAQLLEKYGVFATNDIKAVYDKKPDWVFISTPHDLAPTYIAEAFAQGCHVLVEKPLGRSLAECDAILANKPAHLKLAVGFNYRFFKAVSAALLDAKAGKFGDLISVNFILGHGNAPGMEKTWKLDPVKCGGGCLIDPGVHLLDLVLRLGKGDVTPLGGKSWAGFWNTGIEEEAHIVLSDSSATIFNVQMSLNRWRSTFRIEINGTEGYSIVEGRGRSYGAQSYKTGKRWGWQSGVSQPESEIRVIENYAANDSFYLETARLLGLDIPELGLANELDVCNDSEGRAVMALLDASRIKIGLPIFNHGQKEKGGA